MYQEHQPHGLLLPFVETYWTAEGFVEGKEKSKILPDGCVDITFSFGDTSATGGLKPFLPHIVGTMTSYSEIIYTGRVCMLGIRFKPAGITAFTRVPVNEFTNRLIDMTLVETLFDKRFYDTLPEKDSLKESIQHIDHYLINKLSCIFQPDRRIVCAIDLIRQTKGILPLTAVAEQACLCQRHFERVFKSTVGISPKAFSKITKFNYTRYYLKTHPSESLYSAAVDCGYYDHTHLIKDFKTLAGDVPANFRH
ncbi:hypothetical protein EZS27_014407 [termite gut metagenome]|uniref:HTH araC/xylS-type domain-containing protein n=1 Tax=termite gut metagenome TaxID=433724 RepID=A0A5J4RWH0_9ZZZZ